MRPRLGSGNFSEIKRVSKNLLRQNPLLVTATPEDIASGLKIAIQNGTLYEGLASKTAQSLESLPYNITQISNAYKRDYEKTVIYKLSDQVLESDIQIIIKTLNANVSQTIPEFINTFNVDMLIIVGSDSVS